MEIYAKKTAITIFLIGLFVLTILSIIGLVYLTRMAYDNQQKQDGTYCGGTTKTENNIARLSIVVLWFQFAWVILGSIAQTVWNE